MTGAGAGSARDPGGDGKVGDAHPVGSGAGSVPDYEYEGEGHKAPGAPLTDPEADSQRKVHGAALRDPEAEEVPGAVLRDPEADGYGQWTVPGAGLLGVPGDVHRDDPRDPRVAEHWIIITNSKKHHSTWCGGCE